MAKTKESDTFDIDTKAIKKLALLLSETGLSELEYAEGTRRIRCVRASTSSTTVHVAPQAAPTSTQDDAGSVLKAVAAGTPVTAPMVGTVYLSPEPGAEPFVKKGDKVKKGDTLLIIEAMKVMNPIKAPKSGEIAEIFVSDAKPVEFGEVLMNIV